MPVVTYKKPKKRTTLTEAADDVSLNPTVAETTTAKSSAKDATHKPWSRRVQEAPQPLPKALAQKKRPTPAAAAAEQPQKKRKASGEKVIDPESETVKSAPLLKGLVEGGYHSTSEDEDDSSDESDVDVEGPVEGIELTKLPTIDKTDEVVQKKLKDAKKSTVRFLFSFLFCFFLCVCIH